MPTARGPLDVHTEAEPPFLDQDGLKLNRNVVRKEFSGDMVGTSEAQMISASPVLPVRPATWPSSTSQARWTASRARSCCSTAV